VSSTQPKEAESTADESATPVAAEVPTTPATNDVSKTVEVDATLAKAAESPAKEPQVISEVKKVEINVNGEFKGCD